MSLSGASARGLFAFGSEDTPIVCNSDFPTNTVTGLPAYPICMGIKDQGTVSSIEVKLYGWSNFAFAFSDYLSILLTHPDFEAQRVRTCILMHKCFRDFGETIDLTFRAGAPRVPFFAPFPPPSSATYSPTSYSSSSNPNNTNGPNIYNTNGFPPFNDPQGGVAYGFQKPPPPPYKVDFSDMIGAPLYGVWFLYVVGGRGRINDWGLVLNGTEYKRPTDIVLAA